MPPEKQFKCDLCDHRDSNRSKLQLHRRSAHTKEREFKCVHPGCSYGTNYTPNIKTHLLTHEKGLERQFLFTCSFLGCDFRKRTRSAIELHKRRHEIGQTKLPCKVCPKKFYPDRISLYFHECWVHEKKSYNCPMCHCTTSTIYNLLRHIGTVHKMDAKQILLTATGLSRVASGVNNTNGTNNYKKGAIKMLQSFQNRRHIQEANKYSSLLTHRNLDQTPVVVLRKLIVQSL